MDERRILPERLNAQIARRAVNGEDPTTGAFAPIQEEVLEHLQAGHLEFAVTLLQGVLFASPRSPQIRSHLAFCLIPVDLGAAKTLLDELYREGYQLPLTLANKASAEILMKEFAAARRSLAELRQLTGQNRACLLWDTSTPRPVLVQTDSPLQHIQTLLDKVG